MYQIINNNSELFLVSNEEITFGTIAFLPNGTIKIMNDNDMIHYLDSNSDATKKVLASEKSTPIGLIIPPNLMEVFKGVNADDKGYDYYISSEHISTADSFHYAKGYTKCLQDNKYKRFTLEDMKLALLQAVVSAKSHIPRCKNVENIIEDVLTSFELKKEWKVEIEMESFEVDMGLGEECIEHCEKPKLTKNSEGKESYTITKII